MMPPPAALEARVRDLDWAALASSLDAKGSAVIPALLTADECEALAALYDEDRHFRSRVVMARHGYGRGEYQYFAYPLPDR
ncbi:MAG TPA: proline hydroxylase, partial [Nevskiaceae bacterium]|nr:proline hydroxylase [Nevskiaceae bacterium]